MNVLLLTARDPLSAEDAEAPATLAAELAGAGHEVALVLLEDAVGLARTGHRHGGALDAAADAGVRALAERDALARRGVARLREAVKPADFGEIVDLLMTWSDRQAWL